MASEFELHMFKKGYVHLPLGSYRRWIYKHWHEYFVHNRYIMKNGYGQYVPISNTLKEFIPWLDLYDKYAHDKGYPDEKPYLSPDETVLLKNTNLLTLSDTATDIPS